MEFVHALRQRIRTWRTNTIRKMVRHLPPLTVRIITGFAAFFTTLTMLWVGLPFMAPMFILISWIGLREYAQMMAKRGIPIRLRSAWVAAILTLPASLPITYHGTLFVIPGLFSGIPIDMQPLFDGISWREALLGMFVLYLIILEVIRPNEKSMEAILFTLFGYIYIPWLLGYALTLRYTPDGVLGWWYLLIPLLAVIASDVGAFICGRLFGHHKLAPRLSPNKTLEGAFGGLVLAIITVTALTAILDIWLATHVDLFDSFWFAILVASSAQLGDLFESMLKRWAGVKDTGTLLPGHGGILDRIDGVLLAVPITYYFVTIVVLR